MPLFVQFEMLLLYTHIVLLQHLLLFHFKYFMDLSLLERFLLVTLGLNTYLTFAILSFIDFPSRAVFPVGWLGFTKGYTTYCKSLIYIMKTSQQLRDTEIGFPFFFFKLRTDCFCNGLKRSSRIVYKYRRYEPNNDLGVKEKPNLHTICDICFIIFFFFLL